MLCCDAALRQPLCLGHKGQKAIQVFGAVSWGCLVVSGIFQHFGSCGELWVPRKPGNGVAAMLVPRARRWEGGSCTCSFCSPAPFVLLFN